MDPGSKESCRDNPNALRATVLLPRSTLPPRRCTMHIKQHLLDKRVVKRALEEGLLDKALYQKTLDELPDLSSRVQSDEIDEPEVAEAVEMESNTTSSPQV
jgi:hypothetical protein